MRVLLDENLDHALRKLLGPHEVATVTYMGWSGLKNGELLQAAENKGFDVFLTGDQTLAHEQNLAGRRARQFPACPVRHLQPLKTKPSKPNL